MKTTANNLNLLKDWFKSKKSFKNKLNQIGFQKGDNIVESDSVNLIKDESTIKKMILNRNVNNFNSKVNSIINKYIISIDYWIQNNYNPNNIKKQFIEKKINEIDGLINQIYTVWSVELNNEEYIKNIDKFLKDKYSFNASILFSNKFDQIINGISKIEFIETDTLTKEQIDEKIKNTIYNEINEDIISNKELPNIINSTVKLYSNISEDDLRFSIILHTYDYLNEIKKAIINAYKNILNPRKKLVKPEIFKFVNVDIVRLIKYLIEKKIIEEGRFNDCKEIFDGKTPKLKKKIILKCKSKVFITLFAEFKENKSISNSKFFLYDWISANFVSDKNNEIKKSYIESLFKPNSCKRIAPEDKDYINFQIFIKK
jgi:hypothetical protein